MFHLRLFDDVYPPGAAVTATRPAPHSILYVFAGSAAIAGSPLTHQEAGYFRDDLSVEAGPAGAAIWRWELVERTEPLGITGAEGVHSRLRMARDVKMFELVPTSRWLFRLDKIIGFEGTTGMHSHPGSGIRCMIQGHLRAESEKGENAEASKPGDVWYEEGAYPLVSTVNPGIKTTFLRGDGAAPGLPELRRDGELDLRPARGRNQVRRLAGAGSAGRHAELTGRSSAETVTSSPPPVRGVRLAGELRRTPRVRPSQTTAAFPFSFP